MKIYRVRADDDDVFSDSLLLIASLSRESAEAIWRAHYDDDESEVVIAEPEWSFPGPPGVPEPTMPETEGIYEPRPPMIGGLAVWRGYGVFYEDDKRCEYCNGRFPPSHMVSDYWCRYCSEYAG